MGGEGADGFGLGGTLAVEGYIAGEFAVGFFKFGGDDRADAEFFGDGFDENSGGCGDNDHVVAGGEVVGDEVAGLGVDGGGDDGVEGVVGNLFDLVDVPTGDHVAELVAAGIHLFAGMPGNHVAGFGERHGEGGAGADEPGVQEFLAVNVGGGGSDDGFIQVEKCCGGGG